MNSFVKQVYQRLKIIQQMKGKVNIKIKYNKLYNRKEYHSFKL